MLSHRQALSVAENYLTALVRDTRTMSKAVAELQRLATLDWDTDARDQIEADYLAQLDAIAELTGRYRTGDSILTIRRIPKETV